MLPLTANPASPPPAATPAGTLRVLAMPGFRPVGNPYTRLLYEGVEAAGGVAVHDYSLRALLAERWDVLHVHWPEYLLRSRKAPWLGPARRRANLAAIRLAKRRGARVVWTAHNLKPHGLPADTAWRPYAEFLRLADGLIFLSADSRRLFTERYPAAAGLPASVIPHGVYDGVYPSGVTREAARRKLGLPSGAVVAVSVGGVERYKNLTSLLREQARLSRQDLWVVIAGRPADAALERELREAAAGRDGVQLHLRYVADDELQDFFAAADFSVAPYSDILNSGAVLLSLGFGCPVVCPAIGSLVELRKIVGPEWLLTYGGGFSESTLQAAVDWSRQPRGARPHAPEMQWRAIGDRTLAAYRAVLGERRSPSQTVLPAGVTPPAAPANAPRPVAVAPVRVGMKE